MLISEDYRRQNIELHKSPKYGIASARWGGRVISVATNNNCKTILDYGCGKGMLKRHLIHWNVAEYDPAIEGKGVAIPCELVVCTDVLEHIEPELLDNVLEHLKSMTRKVLFCCIATKLAINHVLPDGRNPHLSFHNADWWKEKLSEYFKIIDWTAEPNKCYGEAKPILEMGQITSVPAMDDVRRNENVRRNSRRVTKRVHDRIEPHNLTAHVVCFGPSLSMTWQHLIGKEDIYCVGAAHDFLIEKGIIPYASIDCDPRARIVDQIKPHGAVRYWLASCVDPSYIAKLRGFDVALWHLHNGQVSAEFVWDIEPDAWLLVGGGSVGLRTLSLLFARGYRRFSIHGMDSSYAGNIEYAGVHVEQKEKDVLHIRCGERWFRSNPSLVDYARQFLDDCRLWEGATFEFHGDGLLQEMVKCSKSS